MANAKTLSILPGGRDHKHANWLVGPVGRHRDSDLIEESNWQVVETAFQEADPEGIDHEVHRFGHLAVGWVEEFAYRPGSQIAKLADSIRDQLKNYSILDEDHLSNMESELQIENWPHILKELKAQILKGEPNLEKHLDRISDRRLTEILDAYNIEGQANDEGGWVSFSSRDVDQAIRALRIDEYRHERTTRRQAIRTQRRARKNRRGF